MQSGKSNKYMANLYGIQQRKIMSLRCPSQSLIFVTKLSMTFCSVSCELLDFLPNVVFQFHKCCGLVNVCSRLQNPDYKKSGARKWGEYALTSRNRDIKRFGNICLMNESSLSSWLCELLLVTAPSFRNHETNRITDCHVGAPWQLKWRRFSRCASSIEQLLWK